MKCYDCGEEACAKVGGSKGSFLSMLLGRKCWNKKEFYVCRGCYEKRQGKNLCR